MPDNQTNSRLEHALGLLKQGALQEAYREFSAVHQLNAGQRDAMYYLWVIDCHTGKYVDAEKWADELVRQDPHDSSARSLLGSALLHQGKYADALNAFNKGIELDSTDAALYNNLAICLCWEQKYTEAVEACQNALDLKPDYGDALNNQGNAWHGLRELDKALDCYRRAAECAPGLVDAHMNIGRVLHETGSLEKSLEAYRKVVELQPERADVWQRCGDILQAMHDYTNAVEAYKVAVAIEPDNAAVWTGLGNLVMSHGQHELAEAHYRKALGLQTDNIEAYLHLGVALRSQQKYKDAADCFRKVLEHAPGHFQATFFLAAREDTDLPPAAAPAYVRGLFDESADQFDQALVGRLGYRVPEMLAGIVPQYIPAENLSVMDLGCGTGLCGPLFRKYASTLTGVDLSPRMIDKAADRKVYDELVTGEIVEVLKTGVADVDLVLAADVLIYLGDLGPLFRAVTAVLRPGGVFAFSIELLDDNSGMYALCPEGRYTHSTGYIQALADGHKLEVLYFEKTDIRTEYNQPVSGLIVVLQKP